MSKKWPSLDYPAMSGTIQTVHLWTQIVGKIRLVKTPWTNHAWHVTLYVSPAGLSTGSIPWDDGVFEIEFDFHQDELLIRLSNGKSGRFSLEDLSVAAFYKSLMSQLKELGIETEIYASPNEVETPIPFAEDEQHAQYDHDQMGNLWQALILINNCFQKFRAGFVGKCSPVHMFWGAFDLAVTRFSGRKAPLHPGGAPHIPLRVMQESYSHEVSSAGFWPGNDQFPHPSFYSYCYPAQEAFASQPVKPDKAFYTKDLGEFILKYEDVSNSENPERTLLDFLQSTYEAAANTGNWNRDELEFDFSSFEK
jgi:hypothetical protein